MEQDLTPFDPDRRFDGDAPPTRKYNQFNRPSLETRRNHFYWFLIHNTVVVPSERRIFKCWEIQRAPGIDNPENGYYRANFDNSKVTVHRWIWQYHNNFQEVPVGYDISHLCGNKECIRPSHLIRESRAENINRIGCPGYCWFTLQKKLIRICKHRPCCKRVVKGFSLRRVNPNSLKEI